jgi:nickel-dependent lactate racemase
MSLFWAIAGEHRSLPRHILQELLSKALDGMASHKRLLVLPSDHTRVHSRAGELTHYAWNCYHERLKAILPALGTHAPITEDQLRQMFGAIPESVFHVHNWRREVETVGMVPADLVFSESQER